MYKGAKELKYNMVGQGVLKTYLYPHTQALYDFLKINNYDVRFKNTNQLGSLKNHLMGAHHTRYEYIFLQWSLIHKLKESSKVGLSTINNKFGKISTIINAIAPTQASAIKSFVNNSFTRFESLAPIL